MGKDLKLKRSDRQGKKKTLAVWSHRPPEMTSFCICGQAGPAPSTGLPGLASNSSGLHNSSSVFLVMSPPPFFCCLCQWHGTFLLHFILNFSFQVTSGSPGVEGVWGGPRCCVGPLGAGIRLHSSWPPIHNFFLFCSWSPLLYKSIQQFFKNLYKFNMCVGFGWAVEIDLRVNHFSLFLRSPLEWFVGPGPFFHWRRIRLSMEEVSISNWWSSTAQMT